MQCTRTALSAATALAIFGLSLAVASPALAQRKPDSQAELIAKRNAIEKELEQVAVIGIDTFGASAPIEALLPHFGFTVERVVAAAQALR